MGLRAKGLLAIGGAAAAGVALGWLAERRAVGRERLAVDPEWEELRRPVRGSRLSVESFDGTRLAVEVFEPRTAAGTEAPDDVPTLVLLHGYGLSQQLWHYQRRDLPPACRVVTYDMRGHAESEEAASGDYSLEALAHDLALVLDATVPAGRKAVLVGHSLGGMTVMGFAERFPAQLERRVEGVVLVCTGATELFRRALWGTSVAAVGAVQHTIGRRAFGRRFAGSNVMNDLSFLVVRTFSLNPDASAAHVAFVEELLVAVANPVKAALAETLATMDAREGARRLRIPTLVVAGERDRLTPVGQARSLMELLVEGRLLVLPGVGHFPMLEAHEAFSTHLAAFADGGSAARSAGRVS